MDPRSAAAGTWRGLGGVGYRRGTIPRSRRAGRSHLHASVLGEDRLSVSELPEQQTERVGVSRLIVPNLE